MTLDPDALPIGTTLGDLLRLVPEAAAHDEPSTVFLTVVVRTQGTRRTLIDTLTCLAAQTCDDFEVLLTIDTADDSAEANARGMLEPFDATFRSRVHVERMSADNRCIPLNHGIDVARGRYLVILDDDDVVFADWVEDFLAAEAPGRMLRSRAVEQMVRPSEGGVSDFETVSGFVRPYAARFDLVEHLGVGHSPPHTLAFPVAMLRHWGIRFDPSLTVLEDWDVVLRTASWAGVVDTGRFTAIYRKWTHAEASIHKVSASVWDAASDAVLGGLDARPLLLPPGSATRLHRLVRDHHAAVVRLADAEARIEAFERSRVWRLSGPLRRMLANPRLRRTAALVRQRLRHRR